MADGDDFVNRRAVSLVTMRRAIESQVALVPGVLDFVQPQVRKVVATLDLKRLTNIFIVGCGDSLYSAMATRLAFEKHTRMRVEPIEALEFSRYTVDYLPVGSIVIGVSAGGNKSRPLEAMQQARLRGATTIVITGEPSSPFASQADYVLVQNEHEFRVPAPPGEGTFKVGNYLASMLTLFLMAVEVGRARGVVSSEEEEGVLRDLRKAAKIVSETLEVNCDSLSAYAQDISKKDALYILGGGPNYATALFAAAKMFEWPQRHGVAVELEEWAHEQYFLTRQATEIMVLAVPGASIDRSREQMAGAREMGARVSVICDKHDDESRAHADVVFPVAGFLREEFSPLTYCVPGQLLALELSRALGQPAFSFVSAKQFETNRRQISLSRLRDA